MPGASWPWVQSSAIDLAHSTRVGLSWTNKPQIAPYINKPSRYVLIPVICIDCINQVTFDGFFNVCTCAQFNKKNFSRCNLVRSRDLMGVAEHTLLSSCSFSDD